MKTPALSRLIILMTVVIDALGIGLIFPVMPGLISKVTGGNLSQASLWGGILVSSFAAMQFIFSPILGNLSDALGRRVVLTVSLAVMTVDYLVMGVAGSIWLLLAGRLIGGMAAATQSTGAAYMADISGPGEKAANFGYIGAAFGLGFIIGPVLGGVLGGINVHAPFLAAAGLAVLNLMLVLTKLPESLPEARRRPFRWRNANPLSSILNVSRLPGLRSLLAALALFLFAMQSYMVIWAYFCEARFGWNATWVGVSLSIYGIAMVLVQAFCFKPIHRRLGGPATVQLGMWLNILFLGILTVLRNGTVMMILTPISAFGEIVMPALTEIASDAAPDDAQGELQGVLASMQALASIVSPIVLTAVFRMFTAADFPVFLPGAPFGLAAIALIPAVIIFALFTRKLRGHTAARVRETG